MAHRHPGAPPFGFGGDTTSDDGANRLDEIATWTDTDILPEIVAEAAGGNATPTDDCVVSTPPPAASTKDSSAGLDRWTTNNHFSFGSSLESVESLESDQSTVVDVERVSPSGSG